MPVPLTLLALLYSAVLTPAVFSQTLALAMRAKADFDKVDLSPVPTLQDTMSCVQSHAALLPILRPNERYLAHYRKGYCTLFAAVVTNNSTDFQDAGREFAQVI